MVKRAGITVSKNIFLFICKPYLVIKDVKILNEFDVI